MCQSGQVEGIHVDQFALDTGCSQTIVRQDLIPESKIIEGNTLTTTCAHGSSY